MMGEWVVDEGGCCGVRCFGSLGMVLDSRRMRRVANGGFDGGGGKLMMMVSRVRWCCFGCGLMKDEEMVSTVGLERRVRVSSE
ncbi:hypothetical protein V6N12_049157 [Hibiscus sabdariffa]|uniref:Transmembrane protein n=1 Tax=Hibiscus sabdariffa TaxID=183260 RepID=A0ABR2EJC8_9ROSI